MATYGSFNTTAVGAFYFTFEWTRTGYSTERNEHYISYTVKAHNTAGNYRTVYGRSLTINGTTVYSASSGQAYYNDNVVTSGSLTIASWNAQGDGSISASFSGQVGTTTSYNANGSGSWDIDRIPRYPAAYQSLKSKTDVSITMNWSSDTTIDALYYSTNGGTTWNYINNPGTSSGSYTISNLTPNTSYSIVTRMKGSASQLTSNAAATTVATYDIARLVDLTQLIHGDTNQIKLTNPGGRYPLTLVISSNDTDLITRSISATTYNLIFTDEEADQIYALYPSGGQLTVDVILASNEYDDTVQIPLYYKGNQRTAWINKNGFKRGKVWIKKSGEWKRGTTWEKISGSWKRGK